MDNVRNLTTSQHPRTFLLFPLLSYTQSHQRSKSSFCYSTTFLASTANMFAASALLFLAASSASLVSAQVDSTFANAPACVQLCARVKAQEASQLAPNVPAGDVGKSLSISLPVVCAQNRRQT